MPNKLPMKQIVTVLLPALLLLGIVLTIPKGQILKADDSEQPFANVELNGKTVTMSDIFVQEETVKVELTGKETMLVQLPTSLDYELVQFDEAGQILPKIEKSQEEFNRLITQQRAVEDEDQTTLESTRLSEAFDSSETSTSLARDLEEPIVYFVTTEDGKKNTYLQLVKERSLHLQFRHKTEKTIAIHLSSVEEPGIKQNLFSFETNRSTRSTTSNVTDLSEISEEANSSMAKESESDGSAQTKESETLSTNTAEEKVADNTKETPVSVYENALEVETLPTNKTLEELEKANYEGNDSLKKPLYLGKDELPSLSSKETKNTGVTSPVIVSNAKLSIRTGTDKFDDDNEEGHDMDEKNDIVRSFDRVNYSVSFSIQNTDQTTQYTKIRYRVISELSNAVTIENEVPSVNAEIGNGSYLETDQKDGSQLSSGVMESIIEDTGQVHVPVVVNVYGAKNQFEFTPTFKIELVDAVNKSTGETETFNEQYTEVDFNSLEGKKVKVSARRSVGIKLVQGEQTDFQIYKAGAGNTDKVYDVGVVASLAPIPGRENGDLRGSTYPNGPITFTINQQVNAFKNGDKYDIATSEYPSINTRFYSITNTDRESANWSSIGGGNEFKDTFNPSRLKSPLAAPNGVTKKIYTSQPTTDLTKIGVYDSGKISLTNGSYKDTVTLSNYQGIRNPYTYTTAGANYASEAFASAELIVNWYDKALSDLSANKKWDYYQANLSVNKVSYDGYEDNNETEITFTGFGTKPGSWTSGPNFVHLEGYEPEGNKLSHSTNLDIGNTGWANNVGQPQMFQGQQIYAGGWNISSKVNPETQVQILEWNTKGFQYDTSRPAYSQKGILDKENVKLEYGIRKTGASSPGLRVHAVKETNAKYTWYSTSEAAMAKGKIAAVRFTYQAKGKNQSLWNGVPVTVIGSPGSKDSDGNNYILLSSAGAFDAKGNSIVASPHAGTYLDYIPTVWNADGTVKTSHRVSSGNPLNTGTTAFIKPFGIQTVTEVEETLYKSTDIINIKVRGITTGNSSSSYSGSLTTTLPKGILYKDGTSKDSTGNPLADPKCTLDDKGITTLTWTMTNFKLATGLEVNFQATSDFSQLMFKSSGETENLVVRTVGEMWLTSNSATRDTSLVEIRTSSDTFIETLVQQVIVNKTTDKPLIEVGETEATKTIDNSITYKVKVTNGSIDALPDVRLLDVLPYNNDSRGTKFTGSYTVETITVNDSNAKIMFNNLSISEKTNPNDIKDWSIYNPETTPKETFKNAKAVLVSTESLAVGKTLELTIKIRPINQKAGEVLVNDAGMNSILNMPVRSQAVWTRVYGRELSGVAWYDDNHDGLIGQLKNGLPEAYAKEIPVKLYRSSLVTTDYKNQLVTESLIGEPFVDSQGNSLVKTNTKGQYKFSNLPEGDYIAEFVVGDMVVQKKVQVTKKEVGDDPTKNSKADPTTYKTDTYTQPLLKDLSSQMIQADSIYHVPNLNIGLIRASQIRLFKYESGSAIDANQDGKLSDAEKASGTALAGAEFDIYRGNQEEKIGSGKTDSSGLLVFDFLFSGEYTLVETKAPVGYELVKHPISFTISEGNEVITLYQEDDKTMILPYTGGNRMLQLFLIGSGSLMICGLLGLAWVYRHPKKKGAS
ncbi:hypothetical protein IGI37_003335 [Enterococcus sp. AZ194]|uniref:SpaA isopeptide-forming pilin-related protein n=1 Tax=Enterococcus sp. AZ194 TaxID=2774629 RepID=UPI003F233F7F